VKRKHKHVLEVARALRFQAALPLQFLGDCVLAAAYIINRLPSSVLNNKTPFEMLMNESPTYDQFRTFGCLAIASNPSRTHDKFDSRGVPCVFLGYPHLKKGYKLMNPITKQFFVCRDVQFYEHIFPYKKESYKEFMQPIPEVVLQPTASHTYLDDVLLSLLESLDSSAAVVPDELASPTVVPSDSAAHPTDSTESARVLSSLPLSSAHSNILPPPRRSVRSKHPLAWMADFVALASKALPTDDPAMNQSTSSDGPAMNQSSVVTAVSSITLPQHHHAPMASIENTHDPSTFSEAIQDAKWCKAMDVELRALEGNKTWEITLLPPSKRAIGCKWIYRTKFHSDGSVDKCKARLVALGCRQKFGVDYWETFAPVAKMTTVRTLLAVAAIHQWPLHQMNVSNSFFMEI